MKFEYTGRHIDVTPALKAHAEEHFGRIEHLLTGKPAKVQLVLEVERGKHKAEAIVKWMSDVLTATTSTADMYQSIAQTVAKIEKQALKLKKKVIDKSHRAEKASVVFNKDAEVQPAPSAAKIVSNRRYSVKPMTPDEAVMMVDGSKDDFIVFRNAEKQEKVSVLYKRKDGNYGLIEP